MLDMLLTYRYKTPYNSTISMKTLLNIIITIGLFGCTSSNSDSTKLDSDNYECTTDRIEILRKEIKAFSDFKDTEFELFNVNGFHNQRTSIPGASSWDYKFVIRVDTTNIIDWTNGMKQIELKDYDANWTQELIKNRKQNWKTNSDAEFFGRDGEDVTMVVFRKEGIIYKRVTNL